MIQISKHNGIQVYKYLRSLNSFCQLNLTCILIVACVLVLVGKSKKPEQKLNALDNGYLTKLRKGVESRAWQKLKTY